MLPVCPEVLGGLSVPRDPCERVGERVMTRSGRDCTAEFILGAEKTLDLARHIGATVAVLKDRSPSCGSSTIHDGSFQGTRIPGRGVTAALLAANGLTVYSELTYPFPDMEAGDNK